MATPRYAADLAERLATMIDNVPETVPVVQLARPSADDIRRRLDGLMAPVAELTGTRPAELKAEVGPARTVLRGPAGTRAVGFHASGSMLVRRGLAPFDELFESDPGDDELTGMVEQTAERLGLHKLMPDGERLGFERLWRIKAAGSDREQRRSEPVLCRAIGAYRHQLHGLPVYGRASATVELAGKGRLVSTSVSVRRFAGDAGGEVVRETPVRRKDAAAEDVATRLVKAFGGLDELAGTELVAESFRFGYFDLGRRREQALLAPFYVASVAVHGKDEHSAHLIVVPGSDEQFVRLPVGHRSSSTHRPVPALQSA